MWLRGKAVTVNLLLGKIQAVRRRDCVSDSSVGKALGINVRRCEKGVSWTITGPSCPRNFDLRGGTPAVVFFGGGRRGRFPAGRRFRAPLATGVRSSVLSLLARATCRSGYSFPSRCARPPWNDRQFRCRFTVSFHVAPQ